MNAPLVPLDKALYRELVRRALAEDMGWGDVTTEGTIEDGQRGHGRLLAKQDCVIAGLDVAEEAFLQLDPASVMVRHQAGRRRVRGRDPGGRGHRARQGPAHRRADGPQLHAAPVGHRDAHASLRGRRARVVARGARHAQDHADAARAREVRRPGGRRHQSSPRARRRHPDQGQPHHARGRRARGAGPHAPCRRGHDRRGRGPYAGRAPAGARRRRRAHPRRQHGPGHAGRDGAPRDRAVRRSRCLAGSRSSGSPRSRRRAPTSCRSARSRIRHPRSTSASRLPRLREHRRRRLAGRGGGGRGPGRPACRRVRAARLAAHDHRLDQRRRGARGRRRRARGLHGDRGGADGRPWTSRGVLALAGRARAVPVDVAPTRPLGRRPRGPGVARVVAGHVDGRRGRRLGDPRHRRRARRVEVAQ